MHWRPPVSIDADVSCMYGHSKNQGDKVWGKFTIK